MKKLYLNPEISVYKIASEDVMFDVSSILNYTSFTDDDMYGTSFSVGNVDGVGFDD